MDYTILSIFFTILLIISLVILIILLIWLLYKLVKQNSIMVDELIETDTNMNIIKYVVCLRNIKNKNIYIKDFGVIIKPYKVPLMQDHFPLAEQGNLEIVSKNMIKLDLSYLINSKILTEHKGKLYFYYDDPFSERHIVKSKMLKKYMRLKEKSVGKNII